MFILVSLPLASSPSTSPVSGNGSQPSPSRSPRCLYGLSRALSFYKQNALALWLSPLFSCLTGGKTTAQDHNSHFAKR